MRGLIALLLAMTALAGCTVDEGTENTDPLDVETGDDDGHDVAVTPLVPSLRIAGDGTDAAGNGTGAAGNATDATGNATGVAGNGTQPATLAAPGTLNLTLDAEGFTNGTWVLTDSVDGNTTEVANGTTLPATVEHDLGAGNHTLTLTVTSGGRVAETVLELVVLAGEAVAAGPADAMRLLNFEGTIASGATESAFHSFQVDEGIQAITVWADWVGGAPMLSNSAYPNDIDLFLRGPDGQSASAETLGYEHIAMEDASKLSAGTWTLELLPYDLPADAPYTVRVLLWYAAPTITDITGTATGDVDLGEDIATFLHDIDVPAEAQALSVYLTWSTPAYAACASGATRTNDMDLNVLYDGATQANSGYFHSCEFALVDSGDEGTPLGKGGTWTLEVVPFYSTAAEYTLHVLYA